MHDEHDTPPNAVCRIGGHKHPGDGPICDRHLDRMRAQLAGIARMTRELPGRLVPDGTGSTGDKVTTTRVGSPTPARLDVLNLLGAGGREVRRDARMLSPMIRRRSFVSTYEVFAPDPDGKLRVETRTLRTWQAEPVLGPNGKPLMVLPDDQVGSIPPAEWLDLWVRKWRLALMHSARAFDGRISLACDADQRRRVERARIGESLRLARQSPALMPAVAQLITVQRAYQNHLSRTGARVRMALLGIRYDGPEHQDRVAAAVSAGRLPAAADMAGATFTPVHDPIAAEWAVRYGYAGVAAAVEVDVNYLIEWLPAAADNDGDGDDVDLATFAAELRALHAELEFVLDESSDLVRIGRCPSYLRNTDGEDTDRLCGAVIRQDPFRSVIECVRCHTEWPEHAWIDLAILIRERWPIDPYRRYTAGDRAAAEKHFDRFPKCRGCERTMFPNWVETTARGARTRTWSPNGYSCPGGCISGGTAVAA